MKPHLKTRNHQILEKINLLTMDFILSKNYSPGNLNNNSNNNKLDNFTFDINNQNALFNNPLFKEKLSSAFSKMSNKNLKKNKTKSKSLNFNINKNLPQKNMETIYNTDKRDMLNRKKDEIMKLLNPIDSKFNKMKKKQTKKRHSFNINKPLLNNERKIKFPEKVRNELNKILFKDNIPNISKSKLLEKNEENNNTKTINTLKSKNILEPKRNKSSNYNLKHNYNRNHTNSIVDSIQKLKQQYGI